MRLVTFDALRALGLDAQLVKPEHWLRELDTLRAADVLLFPETWQVPALQHVLRRPLFPSAASYLLGRDKIEMTRAFELAAPEAVPQTLILPANARAAEQALDTLGLPLVVKAPRSSMGRGVHLVEDAVTLHRWIAGNEVLYAQQYLPNEGDVRVAWIGDEVVAAYWRRNAHGFHNNVARGGSIDFEGVPAAALDLVRRLAPALDVDHAGFDVMLVDGHAYVLEFNVLFGNEALNRAGIDTAARIRAWLERRHGAPLAPLRAA